MVVAVVTLIVVRIVVNSYNNIVMNIIVLIIGAHPSIYLSLYRLCNALLLLLIQVALLAPTRVLAKQHERTLRARMPDIKFVLIFMKVHSYALYLRCMYV